jgi:hypothetical protein
MDAYRLSSRALLGAVMWTITSHDEGSIQADDRIESTAQALAMPMFSRDDGGKAQGVLCPDYQMAALPRRSPAAFTAENDGR